MTILGVQSPQNLSKPSLFDEPDLPRTRGVEFWRYNMTIMQQYNMWVHAPGARQTSAGTPHTPSAPSAPHTPSGAHAARSPPPLRAPPTPRHRRLLVIDVRASAIRLIVGPAGAAQVAVGVAVRVAVRVGVRVGAGVDRCGNSALRARGRLPRRPRPRRLARRRRLVARPQLPLFVRRLPDWFLANICRPPDMMWPGAGPAA